MFGKYVRRQYEELFPPKDQGKIDAEKKKKGKKGKKGKKPPTYKVSLDAIA
jgi:hypothetical protein